jgi:hypothetical protein
MELLFVLGIVVAIIAILYIHRKKDHHAVEAAPVAVEAPAPVIEAAPAETVKETTTPAPVVVEPPTVITVEETVAIIDDPVVVEKPAAKPKRAKVNGKFVKDDPATPENEAWEGGVAPAKKPKAPPKPRSKKV